jgi:hypothetical protein
VAYYRYNNINPFDGICEPPLLSRSEETIRFGVEYIKKQTFVLSGQIVANQCSTLQSNYDLTKDLILKFAENFKKFEVIEGPVIFSNDNAFIESIQFPESLYLGVVPFQITILCYDGSDPSFPLLDQKEEFVYTEQNGCIVSITHNISCRGSPIGGYDPIAVARGFISDRSGYSGIVDPYGYVVSSPVLRSRAETVNKLTAEVTMSEVFVFDKNDTADNNSFIYTYTIDTSERDGAAFVSINGKLQGSIETSVETVRAHMSNLGLYSICNTEYQTAFNTGENLDLAPVSFSSSEDLEDNSISFSISYKNSPKNDPFLIPSFSYTNKKDGIVCFTADITIRSNYGCPATRLRKTEEYYKNTDWYSYIMQKYSEYGYLEQLSNRPKSKSYGVDNESGDISLSITYCNDTLNTCNSSDISNFTYSLSFSPPITQFSESATSGGEGCYYIQNLGFVSRGKFSINGTATPNKCVSNEENKSRIVTKANQLMVEYFDAQDIILDSQNIEISDDRSTASFSFSWNGIQEKSLTDAYILGTF